MISTHRIKNYLIDDPLLDWLHINGEKMVLLKIPFSQSLSNFYYKKKIILNFRFLKNLKIFIITIEKLIFKLILDKE